MSVGDAVAVFMGPGAVNRQPASGVEEQISSFIKNGVVDEITMFDGTNTLHLLIFDVHTTGDGADTSTSRQMVFNTAFMITNSLYLRKPGTTDRVYIGGVQTNA